MNVRFTVEAEADLELIGDTIARDNPPRALSFVQELRSACLGLAEFPERFPLVPGQAESGVRRRVHGNYLMFYRVEPDGISVLHVLNGARDYGEVVFPTDG